jgi:predicted DNA repair protein MutK
VKIDDLGLYLTQRQSGSALSAQHRVGRGLLRAAPLLMKSLTVLGTLAMFLVGGGILAHGWHSVGAWMEGISQLAGSLAPVALVVLNTVFGVLAGGVALVAVTAVTWVRSVLYKK